ncbi:MAG: glycosyltransferase family 2 protein [Prevotella sp.]|nr:glycosyltransferase family 2 protein [Prevotella sp.]
MKFSITIPAYKARFLDEAIKSVVSQTYLNWELIIVDDCSPEDLGSIVKPYLSDIRIKYYRNDSNYGAIDVVKNWNACLSHCTGDYIICMGDDDRLLPYCLEEYKTLIEAYPTLNVYHTRTEIINESGIVVNQQEERPEWESALSLIWHRWAEREWQFIGDFCFLTSYLKSVGGYYQLPLAWGTDDATSFLAAREYGIANTQRICFQYRVNPYTISRSTTHALQKMDTQICQYDWYQLQFDEMSPMMLTEQDRLYLESMDKARATYYRKTIGGNCVDYIKGNPFRLAACYWKLQLFHFPKWLYLKWYASSIIHLFH